MLFKIVRFVVPLLIFVAGCAGAPARLASRPPEAAPLVAGGAAAPAPQAAPAAEVAPAPAAADKAAQQAPAAGGADALAAAGQIASLDAASISPYQSNRKIIKNGEMRLLVADTDKAVDQAAAIAVDAGGYVISQQTEMQDQFKTATLSLGVPVDRFEDVQRRLRALSLQVLHDVAEGKDVSDEYVDLQSRLTNQEATATRVREFLTQAKTVEEALKVNQQLSDIEDEIEKIKGRMNYLKDRSAFSTLKVDLEPQRPTPTPTLTPTPTPTPTPVAWRPGETLHGATRTLGTVSRGLGDVVIWTTVVLGPFILAAVLIWLALRSWSRRRRSRRGLPAESAAAVPPVTPAPPTGSGASAGPAP